jgi:hypothetical protein
MKAVRFVKSQEVWSTRSGLVRKVAVRDNHGRFHGATNFAERQVLASVQNGPSA